ncbi:putative JmjC domain protein [Planoprotostelium fungivorum]|uniref:Putative JmjC domain protein n=1 Tax=Planoprotostelium fungivorum TaxID=1890364 RepID=A0A2P6NKE3_9EUKA|nr:putative JmjC domain protein [Planoprotostelium fungivorum]
MVHRPSPWGVDILERQNSHREVDGHALNCVIQNRTQSTAKPYGAYGRFDQLTLDRRLSARSQKLILPVKKFGVARKPTLPSRKSSLGPFRGDPYEDLIADFPTLNQPDSSQINEHLLRSVSFSVYEEQKPLIVRDYNVIQSSNSSYKRREDMKKETFSVQWLHKRFEGRVIKKNGDIPHVDAVKSEEGDFKLDFGNQSSNTPSLHDLLRFDDCCSDYVCELPNVWNRELDRTKIAEDFGVFQSIGPNNLFDDDGVSHWTHYKSLEFSSHSIPSRLEMTDTVRCELIVCEGSKSASILWVIVSPKAADQLVDHLQRADFDVSPKGRTSLDSLSDTPEKSMDNIARLPFKFYIVEQFYDDLIMLPPGCLYQKFGRKDVTASVVWKMIHVECLSERVMRSPLPFWDQTIGTKRAIYNEIVGRCKRGSKIEKEEWIKLTRWLSDIIYNEWIDRSVRSALTISRWNENRSPSHTTASPVPKDPILCGFCRTDIFDRHFHCFICTKNWCAGCASLGRGCVHMRSDQPISNRSIMIVKSYKMEELLNVYRKAVQLSGVELNYGKISLRNNEDIQVDVTSTVSDISIAWHMYTQYQMRRGEDRCHHCSEITSYGRNLYLICSDKECKTIYCESCLWDHYFISIKDVMRDRRWKCPKSEMRCRCADCNHTDDPPPQMNEWRRYLETPPDGFVTAHSDLSPSDRICEAVVDEKHNIPIVSESHREKINQMDRKRSLDEERKCLIIINGYDFRDEDEIRFHFGRFGSITKIDRYDRSYVTVQYERPKQATSAVECMNHQPVGEKRERRNVKVVLYNKAHPDVLNGMKRQKADSDGWGDWGDKPVMVVRKGLGRDHNPVISTHDVGWGVREVKVSPKREEEQEEDPNASPTDLDENETTTHGVITGSSTIAGANPNDPRQRKFFEDVGPILISFSESSQKLPPQRLLHPTIIHISIGTVMMITGGIIQTTTSRARQIVFETIDVTREGLRGTRDIQIVTNTRERALKNTDESNISTSTGSL